MHFIFDLDHTAIDSTHRAITRPDGSLDLAAWRRNNTRENIMRDSLLPLAKEWQRLAKKKVTIVICTARVMGEHDFEFLRQHGLRWDACLSRREGDATPDADLKEKMIRQYAQARPMSWARFCATSVFFDDNANVLAMLDRIGIKAYNSISFNARLSA